MDLNQSLKRQLSNKKLLLLMTIISLVGFTDSIYLVYHFYFGGTTPCLITQGCEQVLTSKYATIGGFPISLAGLVYYFLIFILLGNVDLDGDAGSFRRIKLLTFLGFIFSLALLCIQIFVIRALCFYCLLSFASSTALFTTAALISKNNKSR